MQARKAPAMARPGKSSTNRPRRASAPPIAISTSMSNRIVRSTNSRLAGGERPGSLMSLTCAVDDRLDATIG
jgi:hypothetical protein